jgi:translocator protein
MTKAGIFPIVIAATLALATAVVGGSITVLDEWYYSLQHRLGKGTDPPRC